MKNQKSSTLSRAPESPENVPQGRKRHSAGTSVAIFGKRDMITINAALREWLAPLLADRFLEERFPCSAALYE
jgi:hypothetical protein